ncbi:MAG TPA: 30S ribosomal protein S20 [Phycisphaerae bacterium]|nr:30S ribosomal protein S20 [Phycisphaerae bacterium]
MAHSLSAFKRIRQNETRRVRNRARKSEVKTQIRKFTDALRDRDLEKAQAQFRAVTRTLDQTAAKGTLHKNMAARKKARLAKRLNELAAGAAEG